MRQLYLLNHFPLILNLIQYRTLKMVFKNSKHHYNITIPSNYSMKYSPSCLFILIITTVSACYEAIKKYQHIYVWNKYVSCFANMDHILTIYNLLPHQVFLYFSIPLLTCKTSMIDLQRSASSSNIVQFHSFIPQR